jgi:hypothetical protein
MLVLANATECRIRNQQNTQNQRVAGPSTARARPERQCDDNRLYRPRT